MKRNNLYFLAACGILIAVMLFLHGLAASKVPLVRPLEDLPSQFDHYSGHETLSAERTYDRGSADTWIFRTYTGGNMENPIHVFVGYWGRQDDDKRIKSPRYVREGWGYYWTRAKKVAHIRGNEIQLMEFLNEKGSQKELVYYCYFADGVIFNSEYELRLRNMLSALLKRQTNAAVMRVAVPVTGDQPLENVERHTEQFIEKFIPLVHGHLPEGRIDGKTAG
jgi:EpsI family protein